MKISYLNCRRNHLKFPAFKNNFAVCVPENIKQKIMTYCQRCVKHHAHVLHATW